MGNISSSKIESNCNFDSTQRRPQMHGGGETGRSTTNVQRTNNSERRSNERTDYSSDSSTTSNNRESSTTFSSLSSSRSSEEKMNYNRINLLDNSQDSKIDNFYVSNTSNNLNTIESRQEKTQVEQKSNQPPLLVNSGNRDHDLGISELSQNDNKDNDICKLTNKNNIQNNRKVLEVSNYCNKMLESALLKGSYELENFIQLMFVARNGTIEERNIVEKFLANISITMDEMRDLIVSSYSEEKSIKGLKREHKEFVTQLLSEVNKQDVKFRMKQLRKQNKIMSATSDKQDRTYRRYRIVDKELDKSRDKVDIERVQRNLKGMIRASLRNDLADRKFARNCIANLYDRDKKLVLGALNDYMSEQLQMRISSGSPNDRSLAQLITWVLTHCQGLDNQLALKLLLGKLR